MHVCTLPKLKLDEILDIFFNFVMEELKEGKYLTHWVKLKKEVSSTGKTATINCKLIIAWQKLIFVALKKMNKHYARPYLVQKLFNWIDNTVYN